jgi:hypothetical protein
MGLRVEIFTWNLGDCSNNGVSKRHKTLTLTNVEGPFDPSQDAPAAQLLIRSTGNLMIRPDEIPEGKWNMFGGAFAYSSDSRFCEAVRKLSGYNHTFPVAIFDRVEN